MHTEYGSWNPTTKIHAVGYDGKWLCGRDGMTKSECGDIDGLHSVTCKDCNKRLLKYLIEHNISDVLLKRLEESLKTAKCLVNQKEEISPLSLNSIIWGMESIVNHLRDKKEEE